MAEKVFKSGFVGIFGRPNVSKSTLLNRILGHKVAIVTPKPQTTRTRILGILHRPDCQIVFIDTPGIHNPIHKLGEILVQNAMRATKDSDLNIYIVDATEDLVQDDIDALEKIYEKSKAPLVVAVNKIDLNPDINLKSIDFQVGGIKEPEAVIPISALNGTNVDLLLDKIIEILPEGPPFYDEGTLTDQRPEDIAAEIIREKLIMAVHQEVPYNSAVEIESMGPDENNPEVLRIDANIIVARPGQKALVIGRGGKRIKSIGTQARLELEQIFGRKIFLNLWVKIRPDWFKKERAIRELGYMR